MKLVNFLVDSFVENLCLKIMFKNTFVFFFIGLSF